jgi:hypothetical protein
MAHENGQIYMKERKTSGPPLNPLSGYGPRHLNWQWPMRINYVIIQSNMANRKFRPYWQ